MRNCSQIVSVIGLTLAFAVSAIAQAEPTSKSNIVTRKETRTIAAPVKYEISRTVGAGRMLRVQEGRPGKVVRTIEVHLNNGKPVRRVVVREQRTEPTPTLYRVGRAGFTTSRSGFVRRQVLEMTATAYIPRPVEMGRRATGRTANGMRAQFGLVAVDPRIIPLGTMLFIEGYGMALAADTGGAIRGKKIDLCVPTLREARQFGRRKVRVHVLKGR